MSARSSTGVTITAFPRVHISLADLAGVTLRRNGGAGFAIDGPVVMVAANAGTCDELIAPAHLDGCGWDDIRQALERLRSVVTYPPAVVEVVELPLQHVGFGTKTALVLAALQAVISNFGLPIGRGLMQAVSGRGGTSGVGIHSFFDGGFVVDIGHAQTIAERCGPSSFRAPDVPAVRLLRVDVPEHWRCHLVLPDGHRRGGLAEIDFFESNTPIGETEVLEVLAAMYHGVCPAILTSDLVLLNAALRKLHSTGFKHREVLGQPPHVHQLLTQLQELPHAAAGMSSMGPLLYVIADENDENVRESVRTIALGSAEYLGEFRPRNSGFETAR